ncbi:DNA polymerase III subunit chi [Sphingomicrobium clamense]|uniref:DNA polymerase III subunit chi n=1 Tax=Sphingomicrobium clamense TaxID=2851013 RepID=A0ABS6V630_9SPHN|nr:DNA polymerase III subunit chi [Sphingomicrobium sp. B8]MBW0144984.1 DNA polymerase III subunit chi [Sphingomicrobium sp. B8]
MRVDFYQLAGDPPASILAKLAAKLLDDGGRLLVVSEDEKALAAIDRQLWDEPGFLAHGREGGADDQHQPILLSTRDVAANRARNIAIIDGKWRPTALSFDRAFFLFDEDHLDAAREAWKSLKGSDEVERHYWAREEGRWTQKA